VHACLGPDLVCDWDVVQSLVFEMGVPVTDCDLVLVEKGKVQHGWAVVVDWVRNECVRGVCKTKIYYIADVDQVLGSLGGLAASLRSAVLLVYVACN